MYYFRRKRSFQLNIFCSECEFFDKRIFVSWYKYHHKVCYFHICFNSSLFIKGIQNIAVEVRPEFLFVLLLSQTSWDYVNLLHIYWPWMNDFVVFLPKKKLTFWWVGFYRSSGWFSFQYQMGRYTTFKNTFSLFCNIK